MTVADFKRTAGIAPDGWAQERRVDGLRQVYVPGEMRGESGWWWCVASPDGVVLTFGWARGTVRDRNVDIARGLARVNERCAS